MMKTNATSEYYRDKVAVVTGGASGIGLALAETMLSDGAKQVVLADFNDENLRSAGPGSGRRESVGCLHETIVQ